MRSIAIVVLLLTVAAACALAQRPIERTPTVQRPVTGSLSAVTPVMRSEQFSRVLAARNIAGQQNAVEQFRALPDDLQESILAALDAEFAAQLWRVQVRFDPGLLAALAAREFALKQIVPDYGQIGEWSFAIGPGFDSDCKVRIGPLWAETYFIPWDEGALGKTLAFKVYDSVPRAQNSPIYVRNTRTGEITDTLQYRIVAPRGYRGVHGWAFPNFADPQIDWKLFRDYFGASRTEYPDGTHRLSAQLWYDAGYSIAGDGGDCFGMSVSSLRLRFGRHDHMFYRWLFDSGLKLDRVWDWGWSNLTRETVQQQQGSWFCSQVLDAHAVRRWLDGPREAYNRAAALAHAPTDAPVLVMWGPNWGHAVVPYDVATAGDDHRIMLYDNNNPYRENEPAPRDPDVAHVAWGAQTFSYGPANDGVCLSFSECAPANPSFPAFFPGDAVGATGTPGDNLVVAIVSEGTRVAQITDQDGRTFFAGDGSVRTDPASAIPFASPIWPLVQRPVAREADQTPLPPGRTPRLPTARAPRIFVFAQQAGRTLTFDLAGAGEQRCTLFQPGQVFDLRATGQGSLTFEGLAGPTPPQVRFNDVAALRPIAATVLRTRADSDRVFEVQNVRGLGQGALRLVPSPDGSDLQILAPGGVQFDLQVQGLVGRGPQQARFTALTVEPGGGATLSPTQWRSLRTSALQLNVRNLQTNAPLRQIRVRQ